MKTLKRVYDEKTLSTYMDRYWFYDEEDTDFLLGISEAELQVVDRGFAHTRIPLTAEYHQRLVETVNWLGFTTCLHGLPPRNGKREWTHYVLRDYQLGQSLTEATLECRNVLRWSS